MKQSKKGRNIDYLNSLDKVKVFKERILNSDDIIEDVRLNELITNDMNSILSEVGGQDGMYKNFPIFRIYRGDIVRVYGLDGYGGVCIIVKDNKFQVLTLGEDDAYHFLTSHRIYQTYSGNKVGFLHLLSETLSYFNNISF